MTIRPNRVAGFMTALFLGTSAPSLAGSAHAQSTVDDAPGFTIGGDVRARFEGIDGQFRPGAPADDAALLLRTRIIAEYKGDGWRIGGELDDSRGYFERRGSAIGTTEVNAVEPVQAHIGADLAPGLAATAGRFVIELPSDRLVAHNNFRNTTNSFTGARVDWRHGGMSATGFWTMPDRRLPDDPDGIRDNAVAIDKVGTAQQFFGGYLTLPLADKVSLDLYSFRLVEHDAPGFATRDRRLVTSGARLYRAPHAGSADAEIEAAWQTGTTRSSSAASDTDDIGVTAWLAHAEAGWTFASGWQPRVAVLFDYASGDRPGGRYGRFDGLFGARVGDFGFTSFYGPVGRSNLISPALRLEATPDKRWDFNATARLLRLDSATDGFANTRVADAAGLSGRDAGFQLDGRVRYWLVPKRARIAVGAAWLDKGRFLRDAPGAPDTGDTRYGFVEMTIGI